MTKYMGMGLLYVTLATGIANAHGGIYPTQIKENLPIETIELIRQYKEKKQKESKKNQLVLNKKFGTQYQNFVESADAKFNASLMDKLVTRKELADIYHDLSKAKSIANDKDPNEQAFVGDVQDLYTCVKADYVDGLSKLELTLKKYGLDVEVEKGELQIKDYVVPIILISMFLGFGCLGGHAIYQDLKEYISGDKQYINYRRRNKIRIKRM